MVQLGVFFAVTVGLLVLFHSLHHVLQSDRAKVHKRMAAEFAKRPAESARNALYKDVDSLSLILRQEERASRRQHEGFFRSPIGALAKHVEEQLRRAKIRLRVGQFLCVAQGAGIGLGTLAYCLGGWCAGLAAYAAGLCVPFIFVRIKLKWRQDKFLKQLPGAFELMARVIRTGQSVPQAFHAVADALSEPLASEFASCQQQQALGLRPEVACREMAQRSGIVELRIFVMAMMIQRQTGGNLSEVLDRLAAMVRARSRFRQHMRTLTAEGRLQGLTLVVLPVVMFVALYFLNRQYAQALLTHVRLLLATAACMAVGVIWIRRITRFEV